MPTTLAAARSATRDRARAQTSAHTWLGSGLIAVGLGLSTVSLLGPFATGVTRIGLVILAFAVFGRSPEKTGAKALTTTVPAAG